MKKLLLSAVAAAMLCSAPVNAQAAQEIDLAKLSCKEFIGTSEEFTKQMLMWLDGYLSAASDNTIFSEEWIMQLATHMGGYCAQNPDKTIFDALDAMPAE